MDHGAVTQVEKVVSTLRTIAAGLDVDAVPDADVAAVVEGLAQAKRLVEGALLVMARRAEQAQVHRSSQHADPARWLADATGTSVSRAKKQLHTSWQLTDQPATRAALSEGKLSEEQAGMVAEAAADAPERAGELLDAAAAQSVPDLRRTCRQVRQQADPDREATRERHHRRRHFRPWTESDGEWRGSLSAPGDMGAHIEAAIRAEHDRLFKAAHAAGRREEDGCYRLDALVNVLLRGAGVAAPAETAATATDGPTSAQPPARTTGACRCWGSSRSSGRQTKVIIRVDGAALQRGRLESGETCHIAGIGEVSLAAVRRQIPDAHLAYVIANGTDTSVAHLGRQASARQRTALEARGYQCEVPHCRSEHLLEIDHVTDWAFSHRTKLDELALLCGHDHDLKTNHGYRLIGPPGQRRWLDPDGNEVSRDPP